MAANRGSFTLLIIALILVFGGGWLASSVQTAGGKVEVRDVRFEGTGGITMSGLLYVPDNASAQSPAPGVLAIHGYINSRETQSPYAIELARRGYVVLALDQTGHGYSDPPAFANGFGGPDGFSYLRSLEFVQQDQIVLSGHSMGGWASLVAAGTFPDAYTSIVVSGSSTGTYGAPEGNAEFPRNFALVWGEYDEFSGLMWGAPVAADIVNTEKLQTVFGTDEPVEVGRLYGSIEQGTARKLYMPAQTHPANHITAEGVAPVIDWVQMTTQTPNPLPPEDQIWQWKEFGTLLSLIGGVLFLFGFGGLLLDSGLFARLHEAPAAAAGITGAGWWFGAALFVIIPMLTYFPLQALAAQVVPEANAILSQNVTTGIMFWAAGNALISLVLFSLWHVVAGRKKGGNAVNYGLGWGGRASAAGRIGLSLLLSAVIVLVAHLLLQLTDWLFNTDWRWWVVAAKPLDWLRFGILLAYAVPFTLFFIMAGVVMHGQLRSPQSSGFVGAMIRNAVLMGLGIALLLIFQYVPLLTGGTLALADTGAALLSIVAFQFVMVLPVAGLLSTYFFHKTGHVYVGGIMNGLFVTGLIVGGQAIHYAF